MRDRGILSQARDPRRVAGCPRDGRSLRAGYAALLLGERVEGPAVCGDE
jgi:hypothetical protein